MEIRNWPFFGLLLVIMFSFFYIIFEAQNKDHKARTECVEDGGRYIKSGKGYECIYAEQDISSKR